MMATCSEEDQIIAATSKTHDDFTQSQQHKDELHDLFRTKAQVVRRQTQFLLTTKNPSPVHSLNTESQELVLRAVSRIKTDDSQHVIKVLDESRELLRSSLDEFRREHNEYRKQLEQISKGKATRRLSKDNSILINNDLSTSPQYGTYVRSSISSNHGNMQHPSDQAAVAKYLRQREKRKGAENVARSQDISPYFLEQQTAEIIKRMKGANMKMEHERQRQNEIIRARMHEKKTEADNLNQVHQILDRANEADLARQRVEQTQREKVEAHLLTIRHQNKDSAKTIQVQSLVNEDDEDSSQQQGHRAKKTDEQRNTDVPQRPWSSASLHGNEKPSDKFTTVQI